MGKQKYKTRGERSQSTNTVDWERVARDLVRRGLCSTMILTRPMKRTEDD